MNSATRNDVPELSGGAGAGNRYTLFASMAPVFVVMALSVSALTQRNAAGVSREDGPFGSLSPAQAHCLARNVCSELTGGAASVQELSRRSVYSPRRRIGMKEWHVACESAGAKYLVRIDAKTGRVYAVNQIAGGAPTPAAAESGTAAEAEKRAKHYLRVLGVDTNRLHPVPRSLSATASHGTQQWDFHYTFSTPHAGARTVTVSVDAATGRFLNAWNPSSRL